MSQFPIVRAFVHSSKRASGDTGNWSFLFNSNAMGDLRDYYVKVEWHTLNENDSWFIESNDISQPNTYDCRTGKPSTIIAPTVTGSFPMDYVPLSNSGVLRGEISFKVTDGTGAVQTPTNDWGMMLIFMHASDVMK